MTLRTLNYGNYGIFLIMGNAGFCPSAVVSYLPGPYGTYLFRAPYYDVLIKVLKKVGYVGLRYLSGIMGNQRLTFFRILRIIIGTILPQKVKGYLLYY